jgi:hypothetical protein
VAVRITSAAQAYTRAISLGSLTALTVACWVKISVDTNAQATLWVVDNGTSDYIGIRSDATGTLMRVLSDTSTSGSRELAVGTWYFVALAMDASSGRLVTYAAGDTAFTTTTFGAFVTTFAANLRIGKWPTNGDVINGCVAGFKLWTATLSQAELEAEAFQYLPARATNLRVWYPFLAASTADFSGNAQTLSGGTGATTEDGPPIRWGGGRHRIIVPNAGGALGEFAAVLPALTGAGSGDVVVSGLQPAVLPPLTAALDAAAAVEVQAAAALPALDASVAGDVAAPGLLDAHLPALTGAFDGLLTGGFLTAQLPAFTGSLQGQAAAQGVVSAVLPPLTGSLSGVAEIPHNNLDVTVGAPYRGWTSRPLAPSWTAEAAATRWQAGSPATTWTPDRPARGWKARQPTT